MILHCYSEKNYMQQLDTWIAVKALQECWTVESRLTTIEHDDSYWKVLLEYWGKSRLIQFQQDVVPSVDMIQELMDCKYQACTYPHKLQGGWGLWQAEWTPGYVFYNKNGIVRMDGLNPTAMTMYQPPFPEYVEGSGIALVKLSQELQKAIPLADYPMVNHQWDYLDTWISAYMSQELRQPWHVHTPPVPHNHY